ncbi:MAG: carbohydrate ABC transporter permease [Candidatus Hydrogenedentota bacterium]
MISRSSPQANRFLVYFLLVLISIAFLTPMLWMLGTSLKPLEQTTSKQFSFLPRIAYVDIDGQVHKVRVDDEPIPADGSIVEILDGPKKGEKMYLPKSEFDGTYAMLEMQVADRIMRDTFPAKALKEVHAGWYRVVEKVDQYKEGARAWTIVPQGDIEQRVEFQWSNYAEATKFIPFKNYVANTLIMAILGMIGTVLSSSVVAYGFSRIDWRGRDQIFLVALATMMIPFPVTMIPLYGVFKQLGMIGTFQPLWVPTFLGTGFESFYRDFFSKIGSLQPLWLPCWFGSAFNIFLLRQFFMTIPKDISEAARIDGCNEFQIFATIILPLARPAMVVVALFHFIWAWNEFLLPLIYLSNADFFTLSIGLQAYQSRAGGIEWHFLMAACVLTILPIIALFFAAQKTFVQGIAMSGMKE